MVVSSEFVSLPRPVAVKPRPDYRIWLRYDDGMEGEVDLSDLAGRGVFARWTDPDVFRSVRVGAHGAIEWDADIDLCPDALYMRLTGKSPEELLPALRSAHADA
jgi:hypothetical protein